MTFSFRIGMGLDGMGTFPKDYDGVFFFYRWEKDHVFFVSIINALSMPSNPIQSQGDVKEYASTT